MTSTRLETPPEMQVLGACPHDCPDTCALVTTVVDGRAVAVRGASDHPITSGFLCAKVNNYQQRTYHPDRILHPLKRIGPKGERSFERVSWGEALTGIASRLQAIIDEYGSESVLPYSYAGTMGMLQRESMSMRFFHRLGASLLARTICASAGTAGWTEVYGDLDGPGPDEIEDVDLFWLWGTNTLTSNSHQWPAIRSARERGARVVCIDPLETRTARASDVHVALRPGTDAAFAFGIMSILIDRDLVDHDFLQANTVGWNTLVERIQSNWSVQRASDITGIHSRIITELAIEYGSTPASLLRLNYGMQRHAGGASAVRAASLLPAITGAWAHRGGGALLSTSGAFRADKRRLQHPDWIPSNTRTINMNRLGHALSDPDGSVGGPPIKAMVVYNSNPAIVAPDASRVREGLLREDLLTVVIEQFPTDTSAYADWILPATTQLEHWDLHTAYGHHFVTLNTPAIEPLGEAASNTEIFRRLGEAMGFDDPEFSDSDTDLIEQSLDALGLDAQARQQLRHNGWVRVGEPGHRHRELGALSTPSGRIELVRSAETGSPLPAVPDFLPPREAGQASSHGGLALLTPPEHSLMNSSFANMERHSKAAGEQTVWIHPDDAADRGIEEGDRVEVGNARGAFIARATVTDRTIAGTVAAHGLRWARPDDHRTLNDTTSQELTDAGAGATFYDTAVEIRVLP